MSLACVGISHHSAPLALRDRFSLNAGEQRRFLATALEPARRAGFAELAILSTCNRTELYAALGSGDWPRPGALTWLLTDWCGRPPAELEAHQYSWLGIDALRHLCRVASGADSMVVGEAEILGQVAAAVDLAAAEHAAGPLLAAAFRAALRAGRRARNETGIGRRASSVSAEAVRQLRARHVGDEARALLVGTGQAARLAGRALRKLASGPLSVVGRTAQHAETLARELDAVALPWHALEGALREADLVVSCTGAPHAVLTRELLASALLGRVPDRPLLIADLGVPRDVEASARSLPLLTVLDLDDVQQQIATNLAQRRRELPRVEAIVEQEVGRFEEWLRGEELRPVLTAMREHGEMLRRRELERTLRRLGPTGTDPRIRERLDELTRGLLAKLLHRPTRRLREETDPAQRRLWSRAVLELFVESRDAGGTVPD